LEEVKTTLHGKLDDVRYPSDESLKEVILKLQESDWPEDSKITLKKLCVRFGVDCQIIFISKNLVLLEG
jgi:hypothetical protein